MRQTINYEFPSFLNITLFSENGFRSCKGNYRHVGYFFIDVPIQATYYFQWNKICYTIPCLQCYKNGKMQ